MASVAISLLLVPSDWRKGETPRVEQLLLLCGIPNPTSRSEASLTLLCRLAERLHDPHLARRCLSGVEWIHEVGRLVPPDVRAVSTKRPFSYRP